VNVFGADHGVPPMIGAVGRRFDRFPAIALG
jgi:hypothetical protein